MTDDEILERARAVIRKRWLRQGSLIFDSPKKSHDAMRTYLGGHHHEVFGVAFLDNRNRLIEFREMFYGTIDGASVHVREIVRAALELNAAGIILAHNHPSGVAEPSRADRAITRRIQEAMTYIDVRTLDHIVIGDEPVSFAEQGWL